MSIWTKRPALRWLVPGVAAVLAIGAGAAANAVTTDDGPDLAPRSAAQLLVDLQDAQVGALSGTLVLNSDLGLPALPEGTGQGSHAQGSHADLSELWSGSHTLRLWYDGPERVRLALLDTLSQSDIIRNGSDVWVWDSGENTATHVALPAGTGDAPPHPSPLPVTPQDAAEQALAAIDESTEVSTDTTRIAGRDAYELVLAPRDDATLVREIRVAIDAEHSVPLGVEVYGAPEEPAFEVEFTHISFTAPDAEQFEFNPPPGADVTEADLSSLLPLGPDGMGEPPEVTVEGEGWTRVLAVRMPEELDLSGLDWLLADGLSGTLFSVLTTDSGWLLVGAVTPQRLAEVAAGLPE